MPINVLVVSNFRLLLQILTDLIEDKPSVFSLAGSANSPLQAIELARNDETIDLVLLDIDGLGENALGMISALHAASRAKILLLTRAENNALVDTAIVRGARGVVGRDTAPELLITAMQKVHEGQVWLDHETTGRVFLELSRSATNKPAAAGPSKMDSLTDREKEIIACLVCSNGDPAKTIAAKLHISESTLRNHLTAIYDKLGVVNRHGLVAYVSHNNPGFRIAE